MKQLVWALLLGPMALCAQEKGIDFSKNLSWQEILQKAKAENKYVFVDCYTTWCGPCKYMDKNVYTNDMVGEFLGAKFECVKVQMDTTKNDDMAVQSWYATAHKLNEQYHVRAYPTYLFFSPEGKIVHKGLGALKMADFLELAKAAADPQKQYYTLLGAYQRGNKDYEVLPYLALCSMMIQDVNMAERIAREYMHHYLETLPETQLWTMENLDFIHGYWITVKSKDKLFRLTNRDRKAIDSVMNKPGYAKKMIDELIYREEVALHVAQGIKYGHEPRWNKIERSIGKKFGDEFVEKNVIDGKVKFYKNTKQWSKYAQSYFQRVQLEGFDSTQSKGAQSLHRNNDAYEIFRYSNDHQQLETALSWADQALALLPNPDAPTLDTKANLLYKLGRKDEGLALEEQSHNLSPRDKEISDNYQKMKSGQPTWLKD